MKGKYYYYLKIQKYYKIFKNTKIIQNYKMTKNCTQVYFQNISKQTFDQNEQWN